VGDEGVVLTGLVLAVNGGGWGLVEGGGAVEGEAGLLVLGLLRAGVEGAVGSGLSFPSNSIFLLEEGGGLEVLLVLLDLLPGLTLRTSLGRTSPPFLETLLSELKLFSLVGF
jgi:hypothetical protein